MGGEATHDDENKTEAAPDAPDSAPETAPDAEAPAEATESEVGQVNDGNSTEARPEGEPANDESPVTE